MIWLLTNGAKLMEGLCVSNQIRVSFLVSPVVCVCV